MRLFGDLEKVLWGQRGAEMSRASWKPSWKRGWVLEVGRVWIYRIGMMVRAFQATEAEGAKARRQPCVRGMCSAVTGELLLGPRGRCQVMEMGQEK